MKIRYTFLLVLLLNILVVSAQNVSYSERSADKYYRDLNYLNAIIAYEDILKDDSANQRVLPKLADSYKKVGAYGQAERVYAKAVKNEPQNADYALAYAQTLAINKKYSESLVYYQAYANLRPGDRRGAAFTKAYSNISELTKDSSRRQAGIVNFNSDQSDFSPAFYKNGLVFCSNRIEGGLIKRVFEWNHSAFLDLFYIPDTTKIKASGKTDTTDAYLRKKVVTYNDDDTYETSNDSKVAGFTSFKAIDTGAMHITPAIEVERFSKKLESKYHEGPVSFFSNQESIIFTRNNFNKGKYRKASDGINKLKLYSAVYKDGAWTKVKSLPFNSDNYSSGHPAIAPGDTIMYFASDMPGGYGGVDLYKTALRDGEWSVPENMGPSINTAGNEQFPYVDLQGAFYFASDGHPGLGGLDIFTTSLTMIDVQNVGYPVNSSYDDFGMALDRTTARGFFSSNRRRGFGDDDIYYITLEKPMAFIVQVMDSSTGELIPMATAAITDLLKNMAQLTDTSLTGRYNAKLWDRTGYRIVAAAAGYEGRTVTVTTDLNFPVITIKLVKMIEGCIVAGTVRDKDTKLPVAGARVVIFDRNSGDTVYNVEVGEDGRYRYVSLQTNRLYDMSVSRSGYFNKPAIQLSTANAKCLSAVKRDYDYLRDFELEKIVLGKAIKIDNIYFDLNKYDIRKDAAKELDKIVTLMTENPDIIIELGSHTDCRSSYQYNMTLSDNRAKSSAAYIVSKGIPETRITGKGYGETKLVNDCACEGKVVSRVCSDAEHQANRRTEFQVTGFMSDRSTEILNGGRGETPKSVPEPVKE